MIEIWRDINGKWRWRYTAANGRTSATSGESFASKSNAKRAARRAGLSMAVAKVREV